MASVEGQWFSAGKKKKKRSPPRIYVGIRNDGTRALIPRDWLCSSMVSCIRIEGGADIDI